MIGKFHVSLRPRRAAFALALSLLAGVCHATPHFQPRHPEARRTGAEAAPWAVIERHRDPHPRFPAEPFHPKLKQFLPEIVAGFGTAEPHSDSFLLHVAPGAAEAPDPVPVLLIHGANDDGTRRWALPRSTHDPEFRDHPGLMQHLAARGKAVFAVTFSHFHGDNRLQGEHVGNALKRIRVLLGREDDPDFRADLVTFSKGAMAARSYVQGMGPRYADTRFLDGYHGDVRRVVFMCGPLGGLDMPYRYYLYNLTNKASDMPAPQGASKLRMYGFWRETGVEHILSGYWPGQLQMLADQRERGVAYGPLSFTADANMTMRALRDGGGTLFLKSEGLEAGIEAGGRFMEALNGPGPALDLEVAALGGTSPVLHDERFPRWKIPAGGQIADRNDGLLFLKSAMYTEGLTNKGARLLERATLPLNHIDLSRDERAFAFVARMLGADAAEAD